MNRESEENMEPTIIDGKPYFVINMSLADLEEFINTGTLFSFHCNGKDYYVEGLYFDNDAKGRVGNYYIGDPDIQADGSCGDNQPEYPGSKQSKTPDEFKALPFIDGKTIIERFNDLQFFDM
jgi:hypothetical protein